MMYYKIMKIIYFGTDNNSKIVLDDIVRFGVKTELVITPPDSIKSRGKNKLPTAIKEYCLENNLKYSHNIPSQKEIESLSPDLIIVASFGKIIPKTILDSPKYGAINLHPSLLPKHRGPSPVQTTLINDEKITGTSIILLSDIVDGGPIISQEKYKINNEYNNELTEKLFKIGSKLIKHILKNPKIIFDASYQIEKHATYTKKLNKTDGHINWNLESRSILQTIKALSENPGTFSFLDNKKIKFFKASILKNSIQNEDPGVLGLNENNDLFVNTLNGKITLDEVQIEGKNKVKGSEFARGYKIYDIKNGNRTFKKLS